MLNGIAPSKYADYVIYGDTPGRADDWPFGYGTVRYSIGRLTSSLGGKEGRGGNRHENEEQRKEKKKDGADGKECAKAGPFTRTLPPSPSPLPRSAMGMQEREGKCGEQKSSLVRKGP
jgi:hypothetical protein